MLVLNTNFFVNKQLDRKCFLELIKDWFERSDDYDVSVFDDFTFDSAEFHKDFETGLGKLMICNYDDRFVFQLTDETDIERFITSFVLDDISEKPRLAVQLHRESLQVSTKSKEVYFKKPVLLSDVFWNELGGQDGDLLVDDKAYILRKSDIALAKSIVKSSSQYNLPIVYVSTFQNTNNYAVDYVFLATELAGMAHVVVEGNPAVANAIFKESKGSNPSNGDVCIFLSDDDVIQFSNEDMNDMESAIMTEVNNLLLSSCIPDDFNPIKLRHQYLLTSKNLDSDISALYDEIIFEKDKEIEALSNTIADLKAENHRLNGKADSLSDNLNKTVSAGDIVLSSNEKELYDGELVDVLLKLIKKEVNSMKDDNNLSNSRKYDVLSDILEHNFPSNRDADIIKVFSKGFTDGSLTTEGIRRLRSAGFVVEKDARKSHYHITYNGDERYSVIFSATTSDKSRASENLIATFSNILFGY